MFVVASGSPSRMMLRGGQHARAHLPDERLAAHLVVQRDDLHHEERDHDHAADRERRASEPAHDRTVRLLGHERERREREQHDDVDVARLGARTGSADAGERDRERPRPRSWR